MEQLFADNKITTQEQLQQLLRAEGVEVTQATISRDMRILNIVKVSDQNGNTYYKQMKVEGEKNYERLFQEINDNVLGIQRINFINLIRTTVNSSYANILAAKLDDLETKILGFENHGGQTRNVNSPLGKVLRGCGNSFDAGYEGYYDGKILGTYLHGPLLPKNPEVADFVITKALQKRNRSFSYSDLDPIDNPFETKAREVLLQRFQVK